MGASATVDLLIHIDPDTGETLQQQIYSGIRRAIVAGVVKPGARLPSSRALAADLGVCRTTSPLALDQLIAEGYVATRPGSGTFAASDLPDERPRFRPALKRITRHPPLSARATALADLKPRPWRLPGPPRPFRAGTPAVDQLPVGPWSQLTLSLYFSTAAAANGLLLGFGAVRPEDAADGMRRLAAAIEAAQSRRRPPASRRLVRA
jgi:GntR family transcriptional regulator / MocR family aminotransferase